MRFAAASSDTSAPRYEDPLFRTRRLLRCRADRLTTRQRARIAAALDAGDPHDEVTAAGLLAQQLMAAYAHTDQAAGRVAAEQAMTAARSCPVPEVNRLGRTLTAWRTEFLARFDQPQVSNRPTECVNLKIKNTKRTARGYRSFENYRLRLLLNHGLIRQDQHTTRICECVDAVLLGGGPAGSVAVTRRGSTRIWPLRRALVLTCPPWSPAPAWPTCWPDQKPVHASACDPITDMPFGDSTQAGADP